MKAVLSIVSWIYLGAAVAVIAGLYHPSLSTVAVFAFLAMGSASYHNPDHHAD